MVKEILSEDEAWVSLVEENITYLGPKHHLPGEWGDTVLVIKH